MQYFEVRAGPPLFFPTNVRAIGLKLTTPRYGLAHYGRRCFIRSLIALRLIA